MAVTLTQLRAFLAVVRTGSVRAAAEELVVTQPSVSAAIAALSRELGAELTERSGRSVRPARPAMRSHPMPHTSSACSRRARRPCARSATARRASSASPP